ncbi:MAG TPA: peptidase M22 [Rariglobus sp.]|jgi:tRNA threonylcarbamoyladenosine biosynthesis protein TsaB|nr:peptidase M22 [Rariglobus sp.]
MPSLRHLLAKHPPLLLIDSSSIRIQIGLWHQNRLSWQIEEAEAGTALFACTEKLLEKHDLHIRDLNAYIFCEGPGSVLGIRTAAVALRTWRVINPAPAYAYQSLAVVAQALARPEVNVIADARRDSWHVLNLGGTLRRVPTAELTGECIMPEGFRHWTPLPAGLRRTPYDLTALFSQPAILDADLFHANAEPDAFSHEEPSYVTWTPQVHQAPPR